MHLPRAILERLHAGLGAAGRSLGAAALISTAVPGCATAGADGPSGPAPFAGMGPRANPRAVRPQVQPVVQPGFAQPVVQPVPPPVVWPLAQPEPVVEPAPPPVPRTWECGPCGMG